ncbi:Protein CBG10112 [Caenorhabditis briggsae]|uniref:Protein CBG10112 n=1 Tax=Caenorhabditis briggsae TaxID=6238 RepID=A8XAE9_CAEBR|nr:Protein CBG10112 [Caenorhabditis briggsae]CAP29617.2 Protein CBG10112 [Caenorhabditis briggsae]
MLVKLLALLKKDAILATRSKVWTMFELLLPVFILFVVNGMMETISDQMQKGTKEIDQLGDYSATSVIAFIPPQICDMKKVDPKILFRNGSDEVWGEYNMGRIDSVNPKYKFTEDDALKKMADCEQATMIVHNSGKDFTVFVPIVGEIPVADFKDAMSMKGDKYFFSSVFIQAILEVDKPKKDKHRLSDNIEVNKIKARDVKIPEVALPYFHVIIGLSMMVTIVNVVRTVVTEKSTVKPYLSAIGLPGWLFYLEHFIATFLKSIITCIGSLKYFMGLKYTSLALLMMGVILYIIGAIAFAILLSAIFTNAKRGIEASLVAWIIIMFFPMTQDEDDLSLLYSININYAYYYFLKKVQINSLANFKLSFGSLFDTTYIEGTAPGYYFLMMIFDVVWMIAAALLYDRYGGKLSGIKDLFSVCLLLLGTLLISWLQGGKGRKKAGSDEDVILEGCIENVKMRSKAVSDVELNNVVKVYPTGERAVNGLSFRAIRGQVSILLGQNGCGKSTTFSMISGVALPTSGSIEVAGVDAVRQKDKARKFIGFCPQYNPLYDRLTVLEHLELVNALKEGPPHLFLGEAKQLLQAIRLADKAGTHSANLSGGMKRKLCVCMAMIGGSKVVLLDEPTVGMDPGARKDVQMMLEKIKVNRTILLTTHYMDEAERLGDWVFVMSYGKMAASGSLNYLKKKFGSGYVLTVVLDVKSDRKHSTRLVKEICHHIIPDSRLKDQRGQMIEMTLPEDAKNKVVPLLKVLESIIEKKYKSGPIKKLPSALKEKIKKLKITTLGLSLSSLETVFIRICDECDLVIAKEKNLEDKREIAEKNYEMLTEMKKNKRVTGTALQSSQFTCLLRKRYYYTLRNIYQLFFQIIIPILIVIFGLHSMKVEETAKPKKLEKLDLNIFPKSVVVMMKGSGKTDHYDKIKSQIEGFKHLTVKEHDAAKDHEELVQEYYKEKLGFIVMVSENVARIFYNHAVTRASPVLTTLAANWYSEHGPYNVELKWLTSSKEEATNKFMMFLFVPFFLMLGFALVTAPFVQFSIEERICKFSHQQHLTGMSKMIFWSANILWDSLIFIIFCVETILIFLAFGRYQNCLPLIILVYSVLLLAILPITYVASLVFESPAKASTLLVLYQMVLGIIIVLTMMILSFIKSKVSNVITPIFYILCPPSAFLFGFFKTTIEEELKKDPEGMLSQMLATYFFLGLASFVSIVTVYAMQNRATKVAIFDMRHSAKKPIPKKPVRLAPCKAVMLEEQLVHRPQVKNCTVVVKDLVRVFGTFRAVNGVCLTVRNNECFGLLGTNGAGKTTTFDILTGLRFPSGGSAVIDGKDVVKHNVNYYVGYCPQFDSILPDLKCIEALEKENFSRIAILRKGEMIALGTSQDLKSQYGNTYTMTLMVKKISERERVIKGVQKKMKEAVLKTALTNITTSLVWELPKRPGDKWSRKYEKVEKLAKKLHVKDFMLTQSSLEDTFITLTD